MADDGELHLLVQTPASSTTMYVSGIHWYDVNLANRKRIEVPTPGPNCTIEAGGAGGLLGRCPDPSEFTFGRRLYASRFPFDHWVPFAFSDIALNALSDYRVLSVGKHWFKFSSSDGGHFNEAPEYVSRTNDEVVAQDTPGPYDADAVNVRVPLCAPVKSALAYTWPSALAVHITANKQTLTQQRCGSAHQKVLTNHLNSIPSVSIRGTTATWSALRTGYVRNLTTSRGFTVRVPGHKVSLRRVGKYLLAQQDTPEQFSRNNLRSGYVGVIHTRTGFR